MKNNPTHYYRAQCGEDRWIEQNFTKLGLPSLGTFVEYGAGDGEEFSNTYWLEHVRGWNGLLAEPDPRHVIAGRPRSKIERLAVGPMRTLRMGLTVDPFLSGAARVGMPKHSPIHERLNVVEEIDVEQVPLSDLLVKHGIEQLDVLSIDTEGTELESWRTLDLNRWKPRLLIIEHDTWALRNDKSTLLAELAKDGYLLVHETIFNFLMVPST